MDVATVVSIGRSAMQVALMLSLPILIVSLVAGLIVSIFQAITQIQELTLTFIPKIIAVAVTLLILAPWMAKLITNYTIALYQNIPMYIR